MSTSQQRIKSITAAYAAATHALRKIDGSRKLSKQEMMEIDDAFRTVRDALMRDNNRTGNEETSELEKVHIELLEAVVELSKFMAGKGMAGSMAAAEKIKVVDGRFRGISRDEAEWIASKLYQLVYVTNKMPMPVALDVRG